MTRRLTALAALCGLAGCWASHPGPSDPGAARAALAAALDAWKGGATPDEYRQAAPAVTVSDRHWQKGTKLVAYEIDGDGKPDGFDVQFPVKLTVQDAAGKKTQEKAVYNVSTAPKLVVVRYEAGS